MEVVTTYIKPIVSDVVALDIEHAGATVFGSC